MKRKNSIKSTIILVLVLLALGGVLWWLLSTQESAVNKKLVRQIPEASVETIEITRTSDQGSRQQYTIRRESSDVWKLISPVQDIANTTTAVNMAKIFEKFEAENIMKDAGNLADYGLDNPALIVQVNYRKKRSVKLLIGAETAFSGSYYAKFEDKPEVMVISSFIRTTLNNDMNNVRERKILEIDAKNVQRAEFRNRNMSVYVLTNNNNVWTMEYPYREKMTPAKVNQVLNSISVLPVDNFAENTDLKAYGLDRPEFWLELTMNNGNKIVIKANKYQDNYYLTNSMRPTAIFVLGNSATLDWQFNPDNELDKRLVVYAQSDVQAVKFQRQDNQEQELKDDNLNTIWVSYSQLNITGAYYSTPQAGSPAGVESVKGLKPVYRYTCVFKVENTPNLELTVYPAPRKSEYLITSSERQYVYRVNRSDIESLNQKIAEALKTKK